MNPVRENAYDVFLLGCFLLSSSSGEKNKK